MSIITKVLKQTAVYWALPEKGNFDDTPLYDAFGKPVICQPIEIVCRWEFKQSEAITADGTKKTTDNFVMVGQDVGVGGWLMLGTLEDVVDCDNPDNNPLAFEIVKFEKIPNFKNTEYLRQVYL